MGLDGMGDWESVPHFIERRVRLNGRTVSLERRTPAAWVADRYLAGREVEARPGRTPWDLFGRDRGRPLKAVVTVTDGRLTLDLAGDRAMATHVAALLLERDPNRTLFEHIQNQRAERFAGRWPSLPPLPEALAPRHRTRTTIARGGFGALMLPLSGDDPIEFVAPRRDGVSLPTDQRFTHWRYRRVTPQGRLLRPDDRHLRNDRRGPTMRRPGGWPRHLHLLIRVPEGTPAGRYHGAVVIGGRRTPLTVTVPEVDLPPVDRPIGVYLDHQPPLTWFASLRPARDTAALYY